MKRFQIRWPNEWLKRTRLFRTDLLSYSGKDFIVSVSLYLISVWLFVFVWFLERL